MAESNEVTIIAADTQIKGEMIFERAARILGRFEGKITAKGELQVAESAQCKADIEATSIVIDGSIEGNIHATQRVQLNAKARIKGDIVADKLVTAEGASIFGQISVGAEAAKNARSESAQPAAANKDKREAAATR